MKSEKQQLEQRLERAKTDKERQQLLYNYKTSKKAKALKAVKVAKQSQAEVRRVRQAAVNVKIDRYSAFYSADNNNVFYGLHQEGGNSFFFEFPLSADKHDIELGKEYNLSDMNAESSEWDEETEDDYIMHYYTAATFKKTKGAGYDIHITATITDQDGNQFVLAYDEAPVTPTGSTINVNINRPLNSCDYISSDKTWLLRANDNKYYVDLRYYSSDDESPAGSFNADNIQLTSTYVEIVTGELDEYDEPIVKSVFAKDATINVASTNGGKRLDVNATILGEDGNTYSITLFFAYPEAKSQATITANNLTIDDWSFETFGEILITASDDKTSISLDFYPEDTENGMEGTYSITPEGSNGGSVSTEGEQFNIYTGTITIAKTADKYTVTGSVLAWNNVNYTLNLTTPDPIVTNVSYTNDKFIIDSYPSDGFFQIAGFNSDQDQYLLLTINSATVAGKYTRTDIDAEYTYTSIEGNNYYPATADITVTYSNGIATVTGTMLLINGDDKYDHVLLTLNIKAGPYVPSVRNVIIGEIQYEPTSNSSVGYAFLSEDKNQIFSFNIIVKRWTPDVELDRTYTLADMIEDGTLGLNNTEREYIDYETVSFTKTQTETGIEIICNIIDSRGNTWNLSYSGEDITLQPLSVELGQANKFIWDVDAIEYEMIDVDNSLSCHLVFPNIADDVENEYTYQSSEGEIALEYSYISIEKEEHKITIARFSKEQYEENVYINAFVVDDRGYSFNLMYFDDGFNLTGDTVQILIESNLEATYWEDYAEWTLHGENDTIIVHFSIYSSFPNVPLSEYEPTDINTYSSHIDFLLDAEENNWWEVGMHSVEAFAVSGDEASGYILVATVIGEDGIVYEITIGGVAQGIEDIQGTTVKAVKRLVNGVIIIERDGMNYTIHGARIK